MAGECLATLAVLGVGGRLLADVGVAGLHRLLSRLADLRAADCLVVVAGMDGVLPGVVTGLVSAPVVGAPPPSVAGWRPVASRRPPPCPRRAARGWWS